MTDDKISIELKRLSNSLKKFGYNVDGKIYKTSSSTEFDAWQEVIKSCIQPAPSDIADSVEPINEATAKLKEEYSELDPEKSSEAESAAKELLKMGFNLEKVFLKTFIGTKKASIKKASSKGYSFDKREIFIFESLKEARSIGLINLNNYQLKQASIQFKENNFSIEKTAGIWDSVSKGISGVGKGIGTLLSVPLKV